MNRKLKTHELERPDALTFSHQEKAPIVFVLDNIRSLNNIGSFFRTGDAMGIEGIHLCGITAQPPHRDIHKTALGATESVHWEYNESTIDTVKALKEDGFEVMSVEQTENSIPLQNLRIEPHGKTALIFGNEVFGVDQNVIDLCDKCIEIPQFGTKHSFNVSVCAGIVTWEILKQTAYFSTQTQPLSS